MPRLRTRATPEWPDALEGGGDARSLRARLSDDVLVFVDREDLGERRAEWMPQKCAVPERAIASRHIRVVDASLTSVAPIGSMLAKTLPRHMMSGVTLP